MAVGPNPNPFPLPTNGPSQQARQFNLIYKLKFQKWRKEIKRGLKLGTRERGAIIF